MNHIVLSSKAIQIFLHLKQSNIHMVLIILIMLHNGIRNLTGLTNLFWLGLPICGGRSLFLLLLSSGSALLLLYCFVIGWLLRREHKQDHLDNNQFNNCVLNQLIAAKHIGQHLIIPVLTLSSLSIYKQTIPAVQHTFRCAGKELMHNAKHMQKTRLCV